MKKQNKSLVDTDYIKNQKLELKEMQEFIDKYDYLVVNELKKQGVDFELIEDYKNLFYARYFKNRHHLRYNSSKGHRTQENYIRCWLNWHIKCCNKWFIHKNDNIKKEYEENVLSIHDNFYSLEKQMEAKDILIQLSEKIEQKENKKPGISETLLKLGEGKTLPEIIQETGISKNVIRYYKTIISNSLKEITYEDSNFC